jgi:sarcosine oxidase subunit alpha
VGEQVALVTACDAAYATALDLHAAGSRVLMIADSRERPTGPAVEAARAAGIEIFPGATVFRTSGRLGVKSVELGSVVNGAIVGRHTVPCDALLMSGGYTPCVHLFSQSRGELAWDEERQAFLPERSAERERSAGSCRGVDGLGNVLNDGAQAGLAATRALGLTGTASTFSAVTREFSTLGRPGALLQPGLDTPSRAFVDFQNDVTSKDLALAAREGFESIEHIKRYTTTGMATDQGKTSNLNALAIVATDLDRPLPKVGLTTFRMPYTPVSFGIFAGYDRGDLFDPVRTTPMHEWAERNGAVFEDVGQWKRARYFPRAGEGMHEAVARECVAVRTSCGMFDATTLGKIEVVGPDAATFLSRLYVNNFSSLAPGRSRYGILLRDDGFVYDDGVIARMTADRFHVTTTTGGAARVFALMEDYLQTEWPELRTWLTSTTEQWSVIAVQGPRARDVLASLVSDVDISAAALPHLGVTTGTICGVPMRLFRVSFTGELGFEVNVPADYGQSIWNAIHATGQAFGITPYGTEAMHVMRAEKGYIIVGQDTDGTVTPDDAGLGWAIGKTKPDFVGKRSLERSAMCAAGRKQLVGLLTVDPAIVLEEGAQVAAEAGQKPPMRLIGHVTSSYASAVVGRSIALAMVIDGRARIGQRLQVPMPHGDIAVEVSAPMFYDPAGARLHV